MGSLLLSSESRYTQNFVYAHQDWSLCFPQSSGRPIIKSYWPWRPDSPADSQSLCCVPRLGSLTGVQNIHNTARTSLVLLFFSLSVTYPAGVRFDFIVIAPSYRLTAAASLSLDVGYFFGEFQGPPVDGRPTASCNSGAFSGGHVCKPFYSAILKRKPWSVSCIYFQLLLHSCSGKIFLLTPGFFFFFFPKVFKVPEDSRSTAREPFQFH